MSAAPAVTDADFDAEVLSSPIPVMVDVWASWCAPCRQLAPIVAELADSYAGKAKIVSLDAEASSAVVSKYAILRLPTLLFIRNGEVVKTIEGAKPKAFLVKELDALIAGE